MQDEKSVYQALLWSLLLYFSDERQVSLLAQHFLKPTCPLVLQHVDKSCVLLKEPFPFLFDSNMCCQVH